MEKTRYNDPAKVTPNRRSPSLLRTLLLASALAAAFLLRDAPAAFASYGDTIIEDNTATTSYGTIQHDAFGCSTGTCGAHRYAALFFNSSTAGLCSIQVAASKKVGQSPTDNITVDLRLDDGNLNNPESGQLISTFQIPSVSYQTVVTNTGVGSHYSDFPVIHFTNVNGNICHGMQQNHWYWLVFGRAGAYSDANAFYLGFYNFPQHYLWKKDVSDVWALYPFSCTTTGCKVTMKLVGDSQWIDNDSYPAGFPSSSSYAFSNQDFGLLGNLIRDVTLALFRPASGSLSQFASLSAALANKPPFGWYTAAKTTFSGLASSSPSVDTSLAHAAIGGFTDSWKTALGWLMFVLLGYYLIKRFMHFEL